ncbi:MarR family transcriptional regulator [Pseudoclavibacter chungangensis]|uniref:MarR family transcriptional regulator n=1 Tax=Pseudoclavibacter chungangensis TaxID=587635 RepID=A0A7J5C1V4_9MICO|nr:MarR family transcriptional regulator [Pseudoclavibacter chungangensis]KAB1660415.1 MarR family transcriptional regulator [Pseudoclavibacter chungangensis]
MVTVPPGRERQTIGTRGWKVPGQQSDPLALERQVCFALTLAARSIIAAYRPVLAPMHLTHPQYLVMLTLWERAPLSIKDISRTLHLDPGTLSPLIKRLERVGYVERHRSRSDERSLEIMLTSAGVALRAQAEAVPTTMMQRLGMSASELEALHDSMTKVIVAAQHLEVGDHNG